MRLSFKFWNDCVDFKNVFFFCAIKSDRWLLETVSFYFVVRKRLYTIIIHHLKRYVLLYTLMFDFCSEQFHSALLQTVFAIIDRLNPLFISHKLYDFDPFILCSVVLYFWAYFPNRQSRLYQFHNQQSRLQESLPRIMVI